MHLKQALPALLVLALALPAAAQSLAPMRNSGDTPGAIKAFRLVVGNPYPTRMVFIVTPMEPGFERPAPDAKVNFPEIALAPGVSRQIIVSFQIDPLIRERTIGVCVQPKSIEGMVLPRVCGTYTGRIRG